MNIQTIQGMSFSEIFNIQRGTNIVSGVNKLKQDLSILLVQEKGRFYPDPNFGCNLAQYVFEPVDSMTEQNIKQEIIDTLSRYYPQIKLIELNMRFNNDTKALSLDIVYSYSNTGQDASKLSLELFYNMS